MLSISWTGHVTNEEMFNRANTEPTLLDGLLKANIYAISSDTHQLQFIKLHHFKLERF